MGLSDSKTDFDFEKKGNVLILRIKGRLDAVSSPLVEKKVFEAIHEGQSNLLLDMSRVGYLSSAGMRMLLSITKKLRTMSGKLAVCNVTTSVVDILKMSGFDHALHLFKTEEEALKHF
ncbi:MAG TPA: STAS domain-containing protein [Parachlamydiaceae bacterium]|nr:STAS domain-containing protein [Parachlamydiaceae bacterium]